MLQLNRLLPNFAFSTTTTAAALCRRQIAQFSLLPSALQHHPLCAPNRESAAHLLLGRQSRRHYPARGTKPKKRFFFDFGHLEELTGGQYTPEPLRIRKLAGRDPVTRRKVNIQIGGGVKFDYFMLDLHRRGPNEPNKTYDERVIEIRRDPNRTPHIALVAGTKGKRWIYATENMEAGQIIKTSGHVSGKPVVGEEGNAYPIGSLVEHTLINTVELLPDEKAHVCITEAGSCAEIMRHEGKFTVVRMANMHEYALDRRCMATVGKLSHVDWHDKIWGSPQMHRRFGFRMAGGAFQKKDGYQGRKIRPLPPTRVVTPKPPAPGKQQFTLTKRQLSANYGNAAVEPLVADFNNVVRF